MCYPILPIINLPAPPSQNYTVAPRYVSEDIREVVSEGGWSSCIEMLLLDYTNEILSNNFNTNKKFSMLL